MRFTVKAKLASAFGLVIVLSMVAGGVAYVKLGDMMATADSMVLRAKRMEKAMEVEKDILVQLRAEKNAILATDSEIELAAVQLREQRRRGGDRLDGGRGAPQPGPGPRAHGQRLGLPQQ